jgi:Translation elongation factors (GTPases)
MHKHHIVFRSQGGLDFDLNLIELTYEEHEGNNGPHRNWLVDRKYKLELQDKLCELFLDEEYTIEQIAKKLRKTTRYFEKHFRRVPSAAGLYKTEDIIRKLMGAKIYQGGKCSERFGSE